MILEANEKEKKGQALPRAGEHVVVHCEGYSCLGYRSPDGKWRSVFTNEVLPEVIDFSPIV